MKYEYFLQTWGGFYNEEHRVKHGYEEGLYYFDTEEERSAYISMLQSLSSELNARVLCTVEGEGYNVRTHTILHRVIRFEGKDYYSCRDLRPAFSYSSAEYHLENKWYTGFNDYPLGEDFDYEGADIEVVQEWITGAFDIKDSDF